MNFQIRKQKILTRLEEEESGHLEIKDFADLLGISESTTRRDLNALAEQGLLVRTHGGAMKLSHQPIGFLQKSSVNLEQKEAICQLAANFIEEGDVVFLDCGSTVFKMCPYIRHKKIKVVTNSLPIINELLNSAVSLNFAGGEMDVERQATHGKIAVAHFKNYRANKAFVGIGGISIKNGLSASSEKEAEITTALVENAQKSYFLCDSSKLEKDRYLSFAPLSFVQHLITDNLASEELLAAYRATGMKIFIGVNF